MFAIGGHWSALEIDVEDTASIMLECATEGRPLPVHVQLDYLQYPPSRRCEVIGDNGKVSIDLIANETILYTGHGGDCERFKVEGFERNQLFLDELRHFLNWLTAANPGCQPARCCGEFEDGSGGQGVDCDWTVGGD